MLTNVLLGLATMTVCLSLQLALLLLVLRYYVRHEGEISNPSMWSSLVVLNSVMLMLVAGNVGQVCLWALVFRLLGEFQTFGDALYHSMVNFATLGYGDIVMSPAHRLLGAMEAVNGVLMIGVSTAALMSAFNDAIRKTLQARRQ